MFTLQFVHGSFCEKSKAAWASVLPSDNILKVDSHIAKQLSTTILSVGNNDALAAFASSQKLPCTTATYPLICSNQHICRGNLEKHACQHLCQISS